MKAFVYGVTGKVSSRVAQNLLGAGVEVLGGTRNPAGEGILTGVKPVKVELEKGVENLEGVDLVFLLSPPGYADQSAILLPWIEASKKYGVKKIVLMTAMGVDQAPPEAPFRKVELALIQSGINYEIVRPNWFLDNFHTFWIGGILSAGKIFFPGGNAKASFIDSRDIGDVCAKCLLRNETGKEHTITGPEAVDHSQVATVLTEVSGKTIEYADLSPEDFRAGLVTAGVDGTYADFLVYIGGNLKAGYSEPVTDGVEKILGRKPIDLRSYAQTYQASWK